MKLEESDFRKNITIAGLGLIGGSIAKAIKGLEAVKLYGIDKDKTVLAKAADEKVIEKDFADSKSILSNSDIVIIALYPQEAIRFMETHAKSFKDGAIITDTCSIKAPVIKAALACLPETVEFVGGHPMAGSEMQGFDAAKKNLFKNTNYIITPHERNTVEGLLTVEQLVKTIGCSCITKMRADEHDERVSFTSHLPHVVAVSMASLAIGEKDLKSFTGQSFKDAVRVAEINKEMWAQIFSMNDTNIVHRIEEMENMLSTLKSIIHAHDTSSLMKIFENAIKGKKEIG